MKILKRLLVLVPLVYILFSIVQLWFIGSRSYADVLQWYGHWQPNGYDIPALADICFTPQVYRTLTGLRWVLIPLLAAGGIVYLANTARISAFWLQLMTDVREIAGSMAQTFRRMSAVQCTGLLMLLTLIGIYRIYFFVAVPMHPDEVFSYLFCAHQGVLVTGTNYFSTNNHILFNLICALIDKPGWLSPKAVMRLPSMAADFILIIGIFYLFLRWDGYRRAIMVVSGVAFCYYTSYYAVQGRGYELQTLCALISGVAGWECFCGPRRNTRKLSGLFILSSIAGLYINPTFCYHFAAMILLCGYFLVRRRERWWDLAYTVIRIAVATLVLYLPMLLSGGWAGLARENGWTIRGFGELLLSWRLPAFILKDITYYGTVGLVVAALFGAWAAWLFVRGRLKGTFYDVAFAYGTALALSLAAWTLYTRIYPYERALCFAILGLYVLFMNLLYDCVSLYAGRMTPWLVGCLITIKVAGSTRGLWWDRYSVLQTYPVYTYRTVEGDLQALDRLRPASWQVVESGNWYPMYLRMHLLEHKRPERVIVATDTAIADVLFLSKDWRGKIPPKGYTLWKVSRLPDANETAIYVADQLLAPPNF